MLKRVIKRSFGQIYSNIPTRAEEYMLNKRVSYDENISEYSTSTKTFLLRRWTTKKEICKVI